MSLTVTLASIGAALLIAGIATFSMALGKQLKNWVAALGVVLFIAGAIPVAMSIGTYNQNIKNSERSCTDSGGYLYKDDGFKACFVEQPEILQPL